MTAKVGKRNEARKGRLSSKIKNNENKTAKDRGSGLKENRKKRSKAGHLSSCFFIGAEPKLKFQAQNGEQVAFNLLFLFLVFYHFI